METTATRDHPFCASAARRAPDRVVTRSSVCHVREDCPLGEWIVRVSMASSERASLVVRRIESP